MVLLVLRIALMMLQDLATAAGGRGRQRVGFGEKFTGVDRR